MRRLLRCSAVIGLMALLTATSAGAAIVVNEIMYNSAYSPDVEYLELYNTGPSAVNLADWYLLDSDLAHPRCYLVGTLGVGQYLVVAADTAIFHARFPGVSNFNPNGFDTGGTGFGLGNSSDTVLLFDDDGIQRDSVTYQDRGAWPTAADGTGPTLELVNPAFDNALAASWSASVPVGGTPGAQNSTYAANAAPTCSDGARSVALPTATDAVTVTVLAVDAENQLTGVALWVDTGSGFTASTMHDDGLHGDGAAADSVYGATIPAQPNGTLVKYYAVATDALSQTDAWPAGAPADYRAYTVGYVPPRLIVNEVVASNVNGVLDDFGEHEDWVEIHNPGDATVDLSGMYLTDNLSNGDKWEIPAGVTIGAGGHLVFWCDEHLVQGPLHANIKLSASGEEIGIFGARDKGNTRLHAFKFGPVAADVSIGFKPDFTGVIPDGVEAAPEYLATPSPGASNAGSAYYSSVCINEFHTTSLAGGTDDWVELFNRGTSSVDISGFHLSDNRSTPTKFVIPPGTVLGPGQFVVFDELTLGFSMSSSGEVILLTAADGTSGLDFRDFTQQLPDVSEGRAPDGLGRWARYPTPTPGASNVGALSVGDGAPRVAQLAGFRVSPNPSRSTTEIRFDLGHRAAVSAVVFDAAGRRVHTLHRGVLEAGNHRLAWNGALESGARAAAGLYYVHVSTAGVVKTHPLVLLK